MIIAGVLLVVIGGVALVFVGGGVSTYMLWRQHTTTAPATAGSAATPSPGTR